MSAPRRPRVGVTTAQGGPSTEAGRYYAEAVEGAGGEVVWLEPAAVAGVDPRDVLREVEALLASGGVDVDPRHFGEDALPEAGVEVDPQRDAAELPLIRAALRADVPLLGICRGIQLINIAAGGTVHQDLGVLGLDPAAHQQRLAGKGPGDVAHPLRITPGSRLHALLGAVDLEVNSFHHQAIRTAAAGLAVTARSPDGVVEGLEHPGRTFVLGVQWHPERMVARHAAQRALFAALLAASARRRR